MTDRDEIRVRKALQGMDFPARRDQLLDYARDRGESEPRTLDALQALPDRRFSCLDDAVVAVP